MSIILIILYSWDIILCLYHISIIISPLKWGAYYLSFCLVSQHYLYDRKDFQITWHKYLVGKRQCAECRVNVTVYSQTYASNKKIIINQHIWLSWWSNWLSSYKLRAIFLMHFHCLLLWRNCDLHTSVFILNLSEHIKCYT